jgi:hypothetical protein
VVTALKVLSDELRCSLKDASKDVLKKESALKEATGDAVVRLAKRLERAHKKRREQVESLMQLHKRRSMELLVSYLGQFNTLFKQLREHATSIESALPEYRASSARKVLWLCVACALHTPTIVVLSAKMVLAFASVVGRCLSIAVRCSCPLVRGVCPLCVCVCVCFTGSLRFSRSFVVSVRCWGWGSELFAASL